MASIHYDQPSIASQAHDEDEKKSELPTLTASSANSEPVPFARLLAYADAVDWLLMVLGTLGSAVHGAAQPVGYLLLGKALDAFGNNISDQREMVRALEKVMIRSNHAILEGV